MFGWIKESAVYEAGLIGRGSWDEESSSYKVQLPAEVLQEAARVMDKGYLFYVHGTIEAEGTESEFYLQANKKEANRILFAEGSTLTEGLLTISYFDLTHVETEVADLMNDVTDLKTAIDDLNNAQSKDVTKDSTVSTYYISSANILNVSTKWKSYFYIPKESDYKFSLKAYTNNLSYYNVGFYSSETLSNDAYISGLHLSKTDELDTIEFYKSDMPVGTKGILFCSRTDSGSGTEVKAYSSGDDTSVWTQYDGKFNLIAYSKVNNPHNYVINTAENYNYAGYVGYDGIKGDVRITSDDELVMCHDAGFTLDGNGEIIAFNSSNYTPIRNMTLAEVKSLVFAQKTDQDADMHVPTFEQYVKICKKWGKFCYPTLRDEYIDTILPKMFEILDKYDLRKHTIVNSMTYDTLTALREIDKEIPVTYTKDIRNTSLTNTDIQNAISLGNSGFGFYAANGAGTTLAQLEAKIEASQSQIELAKNNGVRVYGAIATSTMYDLMLSSGFSGTHALDTWTE